MTWPPEAQLALEALDRGKVRRWRGLSGGSINTVVHVSFTSGDPVVLKFNAHAPADFFVREAAGLALLADGGGPPVPEVLAFGATFLLLADVSEVDPGPEAWPHFGRALAALHDRCATYFGLPYDNYIGLTPQDNTLTDDGHAFFVERRLLPQAETAHTRGLLRSEHRRQLDRLIDRLPNLIPPQPAGLLHGDLWSGNVIAGPGGKLWLVDPAVYYGWAEADLAMTMLFSSFPQTFYRAYGDARPLAPGWRERLPIYNLYHLLNHLNLFGSSYLPGVEQVLLRFGR
jgi:fructosamine-3-kinase